MAVTSGQQITDCLEPNCPVHTEERAPVRERERYSACDDGKLTCPSSHAQEEATVPGEHVMRVAVAVKCDLI